LRRTQTVTPETLVKEHGEKTKEFVTMPENLLDIYDNAKTNRRKSYDEPTLYTRPIISEIDALAARYDTYEQGQKFATALANTSEDLTSFLNRPGMDHSNNEAERSLRKVSITRKIG